MHDASLGFVPIEEIVNVFTDKVKFIEEDMRRQGVPLDQRTIIEWFDDLRQSLLMRSRRNLEEHLQHNPKAVVAKHTERAKETTQKNPSWQDRVKKQKAQAIADAYKMPGQD